MLLLQRLAALLVCVALCATTFGEATFYLVKGGCVGDANRWTYKVESATDNALAALYLQQQNVPYAGLAGSIVGHDCFWDDGTPIAWHPSGFSPSETTTGFLTLVSDGSWSYRPFDAYPNTLFLCTDGGAAEDSSATAVSSSTSHAASSDAAPAGSSSSSHTPAPTTEAPYSDEGTPSPSPSSSSHMTPTTLAPIDSLDGTLAALREEMNAVSTLAIAAHTANAMRVPVTTSTAQQLQRLLASQQYSVLVGIGKCDAVPPQLPTFVVALAPSAPTSDRGAAVNFILPVRLVHIDDHAGGDAESAGAVYDMCLLAYEIDEAGAMSTLVAQVALTTRLQVIPIIRMLTSLRATINVTEEELLESTSHTKTLQFTGHSTLAPSTYYIAPNAFGTLRFSMINNGVLGTHCVVSDRAVDFAVVRSRIHLHIPLDDLKRVRLGAKSLCASSGGASTGVVVAQFALTPFAARATVRAATYNTTFTLDTLRGLSSTGLGLGYYDAFLAKSARCDHADAATAPQLLFEVSSSASAKAPYAFLTATYPAGSSPPPPHFVCLRHVASERTFIVHNTDDEPLKVSAAPSSSSSPSPRSIPVLHVFGGMTGTIDVTPYVRQPTSGLADGDDAAHYARVLALLDDAQPYYVRFVPFRTQSLNTPLTELQEACMYSAEEIKLRAGQAGRVSVRYPLVLSASEGILCVGTTYIRVHYRLRDARQFITNLAGMDNFNRTALVTPVQDAAGRVTRHAAPVTLADVHYDDIYLGLVRVADDAGGSGGDGSCASSGSLVRLRSYLVQTAAASGAVTMTTYSTRSVASFAPELQGTYMVCVGVCSADRDCALAPTQQTLALAPYDLALRRWQAQRGMQEPWWVPCAANGLCGLAGGGRDGAHTQGAVKVCAQPTAGRRSTSDGVVYRWPARLADAVNRVGALTVTMAGNAASARAAALWGGADDGDEDTAEDVALYVALADATPHCQSLEWLALSTDDNLTRGTSVVATAGRSVVRFTDPTTPAGVPLRMVPWDADCNSPTAGSFRFVSAVGVGGEWAAVGVDVTAMLLQRNDGYYLVCNGANGGHLTPIRGSYVHIVSSATHGPRVEAIGTGNAVLNQANISLWDTQIARWHLAGLFSPQSPVWLQLRWDDPGCTARETTDGVVGFEAAVQYVSRTGAKVLVDTADIAHATRSEQDCLYACSVAAQAGTGRRVAQPLFAEQQRQRCIRPRALRLSSINYLPHYAIAYNVATPTRLRLTDPRKPPLTSLALFRSATAPTGAAARECSLQGGSLVATVPVQRDHFGTLFVELAAAIPNAVGAAGRTTYLTLCATATPATQDVSGGGGGDTDDMPAVPRYEHVEAYLTINAQGMGGAGQPLSLLRLFFAPMNASSDVVEPSAAMHAMTDYVSAVLTEVKPEQIMLSDQGANAIALFIEPGTGTTQGATLVRSLYDALVAGQKLPLHVRNTASASVFVLYAVEGISLATQDPTPDYPYTPLRRYDSGTLDGDTTGLAIRLFCIVVVPTAVGVVIFSLQRTIPQLRRKPQRADGNGDGAQGGAADTVVIVNGDDSPPPRDPERGSRGIKPFLTSPPHIGEKDSDLSPTKNDTNDGKSATQDGTTVERDATQTSTGGPSAVPRFSSGGGFLFAAQTAATDAGRETDVAVPPNIEDTAASPLYDVDDEFHGVGGAGVLGCSPPLRNTTFAMERIQMATSANSAGHDAALPPS